ncbi:MAG: nitrogen regulation protein NR(II) [Gammaproteobacteria bacterium]|nr:nitrogen regulation protein NR(II) [Gammaproteobacteria bacterium]
MSSETQQPDAARLLGNLNTSIVVLDQALCLRYLNPAAEILFAASARQILSQPLSQLMPGMYEFSTKLQQSIASGRPYTEREMRLQFVGGRFITVDCTVTPVIDQQDRSLILELQQVDRHLRIAREENLLAQNHTAKLLIRGLAHEIKNPLGGLRGAAQLLERELPDESLREYTRIIIGEADRLKNLVNRMLGPETPPKKTLINIHTVLEHVRSLAAAECRERIAVERDYDPSIPDVQADRDQLIQAVLNVVRNAIEAIEDRGRILIRSRTQRQITLGQHRHRLVIRIDIIDNGRGIPAERMEEIFYPMVTDRPEGTGLGLPIAQALVNQHGGLIECSSRPGETIFTIFLPLENPHE